MTEAREQVVQLLNSLAQAVSALSLYKRSHPSVNRSIRTAYSHMKKLQELEPRPVLTFLGEEVVFGNMPLKGLGSWEWGARLAEVGVQRFECHAPVTLADFDAFVTGLFQRITGAEEPEVLLDENSTIRFGMVGIGNRRTTLSEFGAGVMGYALAEEIAALKWVDDQVRGGGKLHMAEVHTVVGSLAVAMHADSELLIPLVALKGHDQYTTTHSLNISVLSMALGEFMGLSGTDVRRLGVAGLLHDIGKTKVSAELLNKGGKLEPHELAEIRRHPTEGARILIQREANLDLAATVAYEHHIRFDGGGYPTQKYKRPCHPASDLVHVCDVYDALRTHRPYRKAWGQDRVLAYIEESLGSEFNPQLGQPFLEMMRRWGSKLHRVTSQEDAVAVGVPDRPAEPESEAKAPEIKAPEIKAPETKALETKAPETKALETKALETKAPSPKAAQPKAPEATTRKAKIPEALPPQVTRDKIKAAAKDVAKPPAAPVPAKPEMAQAELKLSGPAKSVAAPPARPAVPAQKVAAKPPVVAKPASEKIAAPPAPSLEKERPVAKATPTEVTKPPAATKPAAATRPVAETKPVAETRPIAETKPAAPPKLVADAKPPAEDRPATQPTPVAEAKPVPTAKAAPEQITITEPEQPHIEAGPFEDTETVLETVVSSDAQSETGPDVSASADAVVADVEVAEATVKAETPEEPLPEPAPKRKKRRTRSRRKRKKMKRRKASPVVAEQAPKEPPAKIPDAPPEVIAAKDPVPLLAEKADAEDAKPEKVMAEKAQASKPSRVEAVPDEDDALADLWIVDDGDAGAQDSAPSDTESEGDASERLTRSGVASSAASGRGDR